ncbi:arsenate reductase [Flavobacteriaceae bacterium MAR_2010_188]|nr:arsenate reductase [Flavobacteriaceae bacterium MAR_2010_188]
MNKIYYLKTCSTCNRIISELNLPADLEFQNIKENPLTESQIEELEKHSGSYESLFSKRAYLYKELKLKDSNLSEADYKKYLLQHYTFLQRPVIVLNNRVFIGNSKKNVESVKEELKR